jgi:hypothetical protein
MLLGFLVLGVEMALPCVVNRLVVHLTMACSGQERPRFVVIRANQKVVHPQPTEFFVHGYDTRALRLVPLAVVGDVYSVIESGDVGRTPISG